MPDFATMSMCDAVIPGLALGLVVLATGSVDATAIRATCGSLRVLERTLIDTLSVRLHWTGPRSAGDRMIAGPVLDRRAGSDTGLGVSY